MSEHKEIDLVGCFPWIVYLGFLVVAAGLFAIADAISRLQR
jgi:hypothetical protein